MLYLILHYFGLKVKNLFLLPQITKVLINYTVKPYIINDCEKDGEQLNRIPIYNDNQN
jgi:hypothetical protein